MACHPAALAAAAAKQARPLQIQLHWHHSTHSHFCVPPSPPPLAPAQLPLNTHEGRAATQHSTLSPAYIQAHLCAATPPPPATQLPPRQHAYSGKSRSLGGKPLSARSGLRASSFTTYASCTCSCCSCSALSWRLAAVGRCRCCPCSAATTSPLPRAAAACAGGMR